MYLIQHTIDDGDTVDGPYTLLESDVFPSKVQLIETLNYNGLRCPEADKLRYILEGDNVLIDTRDNCIQIVENNSNV